MTKFVEVSDKEFDEMLRKEGINPALKHEHDDPDPDDPELGDDVCPRCGSNDLTSYSGVSAGCEWGQTSCDDCEHKWGDGLPDSQDRLLPVGYEDCGYCTGEGEYVGIRCKKCAGHGIVAS